MKYPILSAEIPQFYPPEETTSKLMYYHQRRSYEPKMAGQRKTRPNVPTRSFQSKGLKTVAIVAVVTVKILHVVIRYLCLKIYNLFL